jgi:diguanylate cyclase (GGDEF)-like protein
MSGDTRSFWTQNRRKSDQPGLTGDPVPRALAVDDDPSYLRLINHVLEQAGFEVTLAPDGATAIDLLRSSDFDLVLIDLKMPNLDGFETLDGIRERRDEIYAILVTGNDELETRMAAFSRGFDDFISKSTDASETLAKLRAARRILAMQRKLKAENTQLMQLAMTDQLTGLSNRFYFFNRARQLTSGDSLIHVVLLDLDQFKVVNDRYGHLVGDRILADVGATLRSETRTGDVIARFGGDEFVMLVSEATPEEALVLAERLVAQVSEMRWKVSGEEIKVGCSFGISSTIGREKSLPQLLLECDRQLYDNKRRSLTPQAEGDLTL